MSYASTMVFFSETPRRLSSASSFYPEDIVPDRPPIYDANIYDIMKKPLWMWLHNRCGCATRRHHMPLKLSLFTARSAKIDPEQGDFEVVISKDPQLRGTTVLDLQLKMSFVARASHEPSAGPKSHLPDNGLEIDQSSLSCYSHHPPSKKGLDRVRPKSKKRVKGTGLSIESFDDNSSNVLDFTWSTSQLGSGIDQLPEALRITGSFAPGARASDCDVYFSLSWHTEPDYLGKGLLAKFLGRDPYEFTTTSGYPPRWKTTEDPYLATDIRLFL